MTQQLIIPAYFYPGTNPTLWTMMNSAPAGSVIIANPASGPGGSSDPNYVSAIAAAQAAGMRVVGYVSTPTGFSPTTIEAQIDLYKLWYAVDGIFCDQVSGLVGDETAYSNLASYIKGAPGGLVVFNCGTPPPVAYIAIADITGILENTYVALTAPYVNPSYAAANQSKIAMIVHDTSSAQVTAAVFQTIFYSAQYIFVTDGTGANPYSSLGTYWSTLLSLVAAGASLGPVLQWSDDFESYPAGANTLTAPWTNPSQTIISTAVFQSGTQSLGLGTGGFPSAPTRTFPAIGDLGPQWTLDLWVYMASGSTVNDPPVINSPIAWMQRLNDHSGELQFLIGGSGTWYIGDADASVNHWFTGTISLDTWHRFTWGVTMARTGGSSYLIVDGGSLQTYGPADTQTNGGSSVVDSFAGIGQFVVGSPTAEAYIDNVAVYRGAFTPSSGGGSAKPFAHMLPAGMIAEPPIPGIGTLALGAGLKLRRALRENKRVRRRDILGKWSK
jgi:hypothetical protein